MPSFTFPSTANAFVLRGTTPVFVDIREDTLNIDEAAIEGAIGERTRAIVPMHYAGIGCDMGAHWGNCQRRAGLVVIEDAAQALCARHGGRPLGSFGPLRYGEFSRYEERRMRRGRSPADQRSGAR